VDPRFEQLAELAEHRQRLLFVGLDDPDGARDGGDGDEQERQPGDQKRVERDHVEREPGPDGEKRDDDDGRARGEPRAPFAEVAGGAV